MKTELAHLIEDYQWSVAAAVSLLHRSGIPMPQSSAAWVEANFPMEGELEEKQCYKKHGVGCTVNLKHGDVDFDFGRDGEICGFDLWRLCSFCRDRLVEYGFESSENLEETFEASVASGALVCASDGLYYLTDAPRVYAVNIDCREPDDMLPPRRHDPIMSLYAHYFLTADLMRKNYEKLDAEFVNLGRLSRKKEIEFGIFLSAWLGFLGVTCEGFKSLGMHLLLQKNRPTAFLELLTQSDNLGRMMKVHSDALREFRNEVFHLRKDNDIVRSFFSRDEERLVWARELHKSLDHFFSRYRVLSEVHYLLHHRRGESTFVNRRNSDRR